MVQMTKDSFISFIDKTTSIADLLSNPVVGSSAINKPFKIEEEKVN